MKPLTLVILSLLFITLTANAQNIIKKTPKLKYTKQLTVEAGGEIFVTSTTSHREENGIEEPNDWNETIFTLKAGAGIFVIDGLKLGVEPAVTIHSYDGDYRWTQLKLYFTPEYVFYTKSILYPYIGGSIGYTLAKYSGGGITSTNNQDGFSWGAKGGMKINAFGNSLLNFGLSFYSENYNYVYEYSGFNYTQSVDIKQRYDVFGMTLGWSVFF